MCSDVDHASSDQDYPTATRSTATYIPQRNYDLERGESKHYQQQFSDMYFLRLAKLKPTVEKLAEEAWDDYQVQLAACDYYGGMSLSRLTRRRQDSRGYSTQG